MYTVNPPIGGRKTLISGRVMSSGYIPPVSSNRARLRRLSDLWEWLVEIHPWDEEQTAYMLNLSATPGKYQTGSTAALLTLISMPGSASLLVPSTFLSGGLFNTMEPSIVNVPFLAASSNSLIFKWALVTAILGRTSNPRSSISCLNTWGITWPQGSNETILVGSAQVGFGGILTGGEVRL